MATNRRDIALGLSSAASSAAPGTSERATGTAASAPATTAANAVPASGSSRAGVVMELMREFSRRERLVLMLRYTEELTVAEIAAVLEMATNEVERMLENIAERVRRKLAPAFGGAAGTYGRPAPRLA